LLPLFFLSRCHPHALHITALHNETEQRPPFSCLCRGTLKTAIF
jgi:hypothetical protein